MKETDIIRQLLDEALYQVMTIEDMDDFIEKVNFHLDCIDQQGVEVAERLEHLAEKLEEQIGGYLDKAYESCIGGPRISKGPLTKTSHTDGSG